MTDGSDRERRSARSSRAGFQQRLSDARERQAREQEHARRPAAPSLSRIEQLGLTPGVALGLIVVASIVMVVGLILTITAPGDSQASVAEQSAPAVAPTLMPAARPEAEEAIDDYLILVRQGMYDEAWSRTTARFQAENYPEGFASFQQAWSASAELEVMSKKVILGGDDKATVVAEIHNVGSDATYTNAYELVFDGASGLWQIDGVTQVW
jgi:hypothetical protein